MRKVHELRWNPLLGCWIIVAGHRARRPWRPEEKKRICPFCPGAPETKDEGEWDVLILPNKYPALSLDAEEPNMKDEFYRHGRAVGVCEVVVETPIHEGDLCDLSLDHMKKVIDAYTDEYEKLGKLREVKYVVIFRNKGKEIGVSLTHPHSQIYALPFIPPRIAVELKNFRRYMEEKGSCLLCTIIEKERRENKRLIYENDGFVCLLPFFAMWPYEVHVYPKRHVTSLSELSNEERLQLADALRIITGTYNNLFDRDMPYIMVIHQRPTDGEEYPYYHMHIEFYPPYREKDKLKYAAGIEWGTWTFTYDGVPEEKAKELRMACLKFLSKVDKHLGRCVS